MNFCILLYFCSSSAHQKGDTVDSLFCQKGKIEDITYDEVRTFTYKSGPDFWKYKDLKICSFEEYLDVFVGTNTRPQIEIKTETYDMLYTVVEAIEEFCTAENDNKAFAFTLVSTAQHCYIEFIVQEFYKILHMGCLACSAHCDISNRDNGHVKTLAL